uniref:Candidate secreted effector n=1 Tax=Meloidogyne incognita TaxID=6306 RepID=A0A914N3U1_MELIC
MEELNKILEEEFKALDYILYLLNQHNFVNILKIKEVCNDKDIIKFLKGNSLNDYNDCNKLINIFKSYGIKNEITVSENTIDEIENFFDEWANEKKKGNDNFNLEQFMMELKKIVSEGLKVPMEDFNYYMH